MSTAGEFRLLQVSDCHLLPEAQGRYRGLPALDSLRSVLDAGRSWGPDALLLSGDLSEDGSAASYAHLANALHEIAAEVMVLPGNHDDPAQLARLWPVGPWEGPRAVEAGRWRIVLLDATVPGDPAGALGADRLAALDHALTDLDGKPALVALHHQPLPVGSPWIDRYPLRDADAFRARLARHPEVRLVTWGHVHHAWRRQRDGMTWVAAPSSVANALPWRERFEPDPAGPACRWFRLFDSGEFATGVLRPGPLPTGGS